MKKLIGLCCLGLLSTASVAQNKSLQDCRAIGDVNARVACYDEIVDARQDSKAAPVISSAPALIPQASVATDSALAEPGNTPTIERDTQLSLFGAEAELTRTVLVYYYEHSVYIMIPLSSTYFRWVQKSPPHVTIL